MDTFRGNKYVWEREREIRMVLAILVSMLQVVHANIKRSKKL